MSTTTASPQTSPQTSPPVATPRSNPVVTFGRMVKFSHTVFALPFALAAAALAARGIGLPLPRLLAIIVAMAGARTTAMGFNRIVDRQYDAKNPRTAGRELPSGQVSLRAAWGLTIASALLFVAAAAYLGPLCLKLTPVALLLLWGYSVTKRFTALCHLVLGLAIASGPAGAWIAVRGDFTWIPGLLMIAVATWIGGFDILYALADRDFDRAAGLHSIPARLGIRGALVVSGLLHVITLGALVGLAVVGGLGTFYFVAVAVAATLLIWEHAIVRPNDLSRLNVAFFTLNGYVSVVLLAGVVADVLLP